MKAIPKGGKIAIELHQADRRALEKAREILDFIRRNHGSAERAELIEMAASAISTVLTEFAETPEVDTPKGSAKPSDAKVGTAAA